MTTKVVSRMTGSPAPPASKLRAMNCEDPANTNRDMARAPVAESPLGAAKVPKMIPKGAAPSRVARSATSLSASESTPGRWAITIRLFLNRSARAASVPVEGSSSTAGLRVGLMEIK